MEFLYLKKIIIPFLILVIINFSFVGCFTSQEVIVHEEPDVKIESIILTDSTEVEFTRRQPGYAVISGDSVLFIQKEKVVDSYHISQIEKVYTSNFSIGKTLFLIFGITAIPLLVLFIHIVISMQGRSVGG